VSVERAQVGHQTRFLLRAGTTGDWLLTYGSVELDPSVWKVLTVQPDGRMDLYATRTLPAPDEETLRQWLASVTGPDAAARLAAAVAAEPPHSSGWDSPAPSEPPGRA
jgi:hypothetical protein